MEAIIETRIERMDVGLFDHIDSQTTAKDRVALLCLQKAARRNRRSYTYLEVGSHLGGSIQPHLVDPCCRKIFSIDPRPLAQPDERWDGMYPYPQNSTQKMLSLLGAIAGGDSSKISTFDKDASQLLPEEISERVDFIFIDGEHTNRAVLSDFRAVLKFPASECLIAFHDCFAVAQGILNCRKLLLDEGFEFRAFHYRGSEVVAFAINPGKDVLEFLREPWGDAVFPMWFKTVKLRVKKILPPQLLKRLDRAQS
jgi:hypothetical protein